MATAPPTTSRRLRASRALLDQAQGCWLYNADQKRDDIAGSQTIDEAVATGRPFYGYVLPHVWGIDADDPSPPAYDRLLVILRRRGLPYIEADSGSLERRGRHLFVFTSDEAIRVEIRVEIDFGYPGHGIDWRKQGAIRPLFAPHRNGTTFSTPLTFSADEALTTFERWHVEATGTMPAEDYREPLPLWAEALRAGDVDEYHRLRPDKSLPLATSHGGYDGNVVDLKIGYAYRNAGRTGAEFVNDLRPGGDWESPSALRRPNPEAYLWGQWNAVMSRPNATNPARVGLDRLDQLQHAISNDPELTLTQRLLVYAFVEAARSIAKTTFDLPYTYLRELSGCTPKAIRSALLSPAVRRYVTPVENRKRGDSQTYRLLVSRWCQPGSTRYDRQGVSELCSSPLIPLPSPVHPLFWNRPGALRVAGYQTLCTFAAEPRTKAEAMRHRVGISPATWKRRTAELEREGAIVQADPVGRNYIVNSKFDWDNLADGRGLFELEQELLDRTAALQHGWTEYRTMRGGLTAEEADERHQRIDERRAALGRRHESPSAGMEPNPIVASLGDTVEISGATIDTATGEILDRGPFSGPGEFRGPENSCASCGIATATVEPCTGLRWCGCLFPSWLVSFYASMGFDIPPSLHQLRVTATSVDAYGIDWSDHGVSADADTLAVAA